jgi:hypothetical protein
MTKKQETENFQTLEQMRDEIMNDFRKAHSSDKFWERELELRREFRSEIRLFIAMQEAWDKGNSIELTEEQRNRINRWLSLSLENTLERVVEVMNERDGELDKTSESDS